MARARKELVSLSDTPYYHCYNRCVRGAFLYGEDHLSGNNYFHRKQWVTDRLAVLSQVFTIDLCCYAVMSNHYHVVVHIDKERAEAISAKDVIERWSKLFGLPVLAARYQQGDPLSVTELRIVDLLIEKWRKRLYDISWYMRCLNEHLARKANKEDQCKGRYWEGRYKSQALLDEAGLLTCMTYVDLNPIRAGITKFPETSEWTSIYQRIKEIKKPKRKKISNHICNLPPLLAFHTSSYDEKISIPYKLDDYLTLADWTGRAVLAHKRGAIPEHIPPILTRLNINPEQWLTHMQIHGDGFSRAIGHEDRLRRFANRIKQHWLQGLTRSKLLFSGIVTEST